MKLKKLLFGSLFIGSAFVFTGLWFAKTAAKKMKSNTIQFDGIDAYVEEQMRRLRIPGAALAIVQGDQIVHQRGFGVARPGGETPEPLTPFFIGSLTKSITATAVMQLVEEGKVELDAPVQRYLPWFSVADPESSSRMTVRHLLNQTSGFSSFASNLILADLDDRPDAAEWQVRALSSMKLNHNVGEEVEYSNLNYNVLGLIIETASAETYAEYVQKHIFNRLGMSHSFFSKVAAQQAGLAMGYRHWFGFPFPAPNLPIPHGSLAAGQLISCAEDMAHYLIAQLNGGLFGKAQILSATGMDELQRGEKEYLPFGISAGRYAMGWFDKEINHTRTLSHGGNVPDFSAFMSLVPGQKTGLVVLFNSDPYGLPMITDEIGSNLTAILAGHQPQPIQLNFVQWIFRLLPLIPLLQLWSVIATLVKVNQWQRDPLSRPRAGKVCFQHILLPLIPNLSLAAVLAYLRSSRLLDFMHLFMPDLAWIARISGGFASIWAFWRTRLVLNILQKSHR